MEKKSKIANKKSIKDSPFSYAQIDMIWDFYVTHTISGGSGLERDITDYGWRKNENKTDGYPALETALFEIAELKSNICFIRSKTCKDTLGEMDLSNDMICDVHPRAVLLQKFSTTVDENENIKFAGGGENHITCLFRHIRNAFAHGNTYFFESGLVLLEDKDNSTVSAEILLKQQTLLDWIKVIDKHEKYYSLVDAGVKSNEEEK
jgi:hypothetical protein